MSWVDEPEYDDFDDVVVTLRCLSKMDGHWHIHGDWIIGPKEAKALLWGLGRLSQMATIVENMEREE
jgi:hypothetical protein